MLGCPQAARLFDIPVLSVHGAGFIAHGIRNTHPTGQRPWCERHSRTIFDPGRRRIIRWRPRFRGRIQPPSQNRSGMELLGPLRQRLRQLGELSRWLFRAESFGETARPCTCLARRLWRCCRRSACRSCVASWNDPARSSGLDRESGGNVTALLTQR